MLNNGTGAVRLYVCDDRPAEVTDGDEDVTGDGDEL